MNGLVKILWVFFMVASVASCKTTESIQMCDTHDVQTKRIAIQEFQEKQVPDYQKSALINVELGLGYLAQGQVSRAKEKLTHALKIAPKLSESRSAMAYFLEMIGEFKEAEAEHKKAISYASTKGAVYNNYGAFLCRQQRYKEADGAFVKALQDKEYSKTAEVYENAGLCALKASLQSKAEEYLKIAVRQDPKRSSAVLELAALNLLQGKFEDSKNLLSQHVDMAEPSARSVWLNIQLARVLKDQTVAANHISVLKTLFQDSPEYQEYLKTENTNIKKKGTL